MELTNAIHTQECVTRFTNKKPDWRDVIEAVDTARYTNMAGNNYSPRIIIIEDEKQIKKIADACQQPFIADAKIAVIVCSAPAHTIKFYGKRGENYCRQQAGAAIQNILLKIHELGLSVYWVRHFVDDMIKRELKIPDNVILEAVLPIGYTFPRKSKPAKKLPNIDNVLYFEKYGTKKRSPPRVIEV